MLMKPLSIMGLVEDLDIPTTAENKSIGEWLMKDWHLGPEEASADPKANAPYWKTMASVFNVEVDQARRQLCANCEYFDDKPSTLKAMEAIPFNSFDADGGGRGFCSRFGFICHNLRTCQAWEGEDSCGEED